MLRFQFAAKSGWDFGRCACGRACRGDVLLGLPVEAAILLALPMVLVQALLLERSYALQSPAGLGAAAGSNSLAVDTPSPI